MNTCKTCKFWDKNEFRTKEAISGTCENPLLDPRSESETSASVGVVGEWDSVAIATGPDFGCIHHAFRPTTFDDIGEFAVRNSGGFPVVTAKNFDDFKAQLRRLAAGGDPEMLFLEQECARKVHPFIGHLMLDKFYIVEMKAKPLLGVWDFK